ncbi:hypothetical protein Pcinc_033625 [Petrolisthes cinctipes]|uniref:Uncharacterized protein n=1 Tax=Petrolisthes cinctipes TaxID=88211 RepID=A0AAE1JX21_PETCI|nr:hypothetical protein Pcinc_033625 [Petrolisthes cinctipes]
MLSPHCIALPAHVGHCVVPSHFHHPIPHSPPLPKLIFLHSHPYSHIPLPPFPTPLPPRPCSYPPPPPHLSTPHFATTLLPSLATLSTLTSFTTTSSQYINVSPPLSSTPTDLTAYHILSFTASFLSLYTFLPPFLSLPLKRRGPQHTMYSAFLFCSFPPLLSTLLSPHPHHENSFLNLPS